MTPVNAKIPTTQESTVVQVIAWGHQETSHCLNQCWIRGPFHEGFSVVIQIWWKFFGFCVTPSLGTVLLQNCTHAMTVQLSCHAQNFTVITFIKNPMIAECNFHQTCFNMDQLFIVNGPKIYVAIRRHYATMGLGTSGGTAWRHRTRLTLVPLFPCYLTIPTNHLN